MVNNASTGAFLSCDGGTCLSPQYVRGCSVTRPPCLLIRDGTRHNLPLDIQYNSAGRRCDSLGIPTNGSVVVRARLCTIES